MVMPSFAAVGSTLTGSNSTTAAVPVPAGVLPDHVVFVFLYVETTQAVTPASGFAECPSSPVVVTGGNDSHDLHIFWKRATAADSGTYTFTIASGLGWRMGVAVRFIGCVRSGTPVEATTSAIDITGTATHSPAVSSTSLGVDREWLWVASNYGGASSTPPSGVTERVDVTSSTSITAGTKDQPFVGSSGSLSNTWTTGAGSAAWLGALKPESPGQFFRM